MIQNVGHDGRVNVARQVLDVDAVIEIRQVGLLASSLVLLTHRVFCFLSCLNHIRFWGAFAGLDDCKLILSV